MHAIERAVSAFESGDFFAALGYVERACRIAPPQPEHSLLRAAILENVGYPDLARDAYRAALLHGLYNPLVRREAFRRLKPLLAADELKALADEFLALEPDESLIDDLIALGPEFRAETVGWLWRKDGDIAITLLSRQPADITIDLTIDGANARFDIPVRDSIQSSGAFHVRGAKVFALPRTASRIAVTAGDTAVHWLRSTLNVPRNASREAAESIGRDHEAAVTIIMPAYKDARTTAGCISSVLSDKVSATAWRLIIVNDASPDPDMDYVMELAAKDRRVTILPLPQNLGFIGAVNAALQLTQTSDVILLNSDTVVAPGFIDRLQQASRYHPEIGTVTPLSNNGELVSVPSPFVPNPMPAPRDVAAWDRLAQQTGEVEPIELPTGVGFCLYITRRCLDATGYLDDRAFDRGYLEEVDFCLRAALGGFRNVCATSVFVGHVGSTSFGQHKEMLVSRNGSEVTRRYPWHQAECRMFMEADPLRVVRQKMQTAWLADPIGEAHFDILISSKTDPLDPDILEAADTVKKADQSRLLVLLGRHEREGLVILHNLDGGTPHALPVQTAQLKLPQLRSLLGKTKTGDIILLDQGPALDPMIESLAAAQSFKLVLTDGSLVCPRRTLLRHGRIPCSGITTAEECSLCLGSTGGVGSIRSADDVARYRKHREQLILDAADLVSSPGLTARVPWLESLLNRTGRNNWVTSAITAGKSDRSAPDQGVFAILPLHQSVADFQQLLELVKGLSKRSADQGIVIIGSTLDDEALMRLGKVVVTGAARPEELRDLLTMFDAGSLLVHLRAAVYRSAWFDAMRKIQQPVFVMQSAYEGIVASAAGVAVSITETDSIDEQIDFLVSRHNHNLTHSGRIAPDSHVTASAFASL